VQRVLKSGSSPLKWQPIQGSKVLRDANKPKRATFCQQQRNAHTSKWVFLDGKYFYLYKTAHGYRQWAWQGERSS
jgi:hypothetical protein